MLFKKCIINGEFKESITKETIKVKNPANIDEIVGEVPALTKDEVIKAIELSYKAFKSWSNTSPTKRAEILKLAIKLISERKEEISKILTLEQGKTIKESREEVEASIKSLDYFANSVLRIIGETYDTDHLNRMSIVIKQPVGLISAIAPWNYPILLLTWKIGPALASGCTVVAKPSSYTPLSTILFAECFMEAGLPPNVLNVVTGKSKEIGNILTSHPLIRKVAFTGSSEIGKEIMKSSSETVKKLTLELGGNCPLIVFDDAELEKAVKDGVRRSFRNAGQICNAINRIYIHESIFDDFIDKFIEETSRIRIGNGIREDVDMGPLTTEDGYKRVIDYIEDALSKGAKILYGGKKPVGKEYEKGLFLEPTILINTDHSMKIIKNETFGPTAPIMHFRTFEEVIELANDTEYGLISYVYTKDLSKAIKAAKLLECGTVGINNVVGGEFAYPYGGWKMSGFGIENSHHVLDEYILIKHIRIDY
jgi:succinate-semialdehyde dehydrogenase